jgi:hypothetical protein
MVPEVRRAYNAAYTPERYRRALDAVQEEAGAPADFRISETPIFLSADLAREMERAAWEIFREVTSPEAVTRASRFVPAEWNVPDETPHPVFLQIDLALVEVEPGRIGPRLIELQAFPSLYGFQVVHAHAYREAFDVPGGWTTYFGGLDDSSYVEALRRAIVAECDPREVALLEIEPHHQKTKVDFYATERQLGIAIVDALQVHRRGRRLFYKDQGGADIEIRRIYNRVIFDEVERKGYSKLRQLFTEPIDALWVGHPNWYFKISKASLPSIRSAYCPPARFLDDALGDLPSDLEQYVLKPLFSFAGLGVELGPSRERLLSIPEPGHWVLQRRIEYAACIATPDGPARAEVRMMFLWPDGGEPSLVNTLVRMSKGAMMGVNFNKDKTWVGASVAFHPPL